MGSKSPGNSHEIHQRLRWRIANVERGKSSVKLCRYGFGVPATTKLLVLEIQGVQSKRSMEDAS